MTQQNPAGSVMVVREESGLVIKGRGELWMQKQARYKGELWCFHLGVLEELITADCFCLPPLPRCAGAHSLGWNVKAGSGVAE